MTKSFFIDQHGCAKNQTDGELITGFLIDAGYDQTFDAEKADLIIINSCGFIESAKEEAINNAKIELQEVEEKLFIKEVSDVTKRFPFNPIKSSEGVITINPRDTKCRKNNPRGFW